jgi:hypothetical protein
MRSQSRRNCPNGFVTRKAYVRHTKRGTRRVPAGCIKDRGQPGKGTRRSPGIGPLRKGDLSKYGYKNVVRLSASQRREALRKAIKEYGALTTWRKLNAVHVYSRYTAPESSHVFKLDMDWIRSTFGLKAN